jgi:hypothetical protein
MSSVYDRSADKKRSTEPSYAVNASGDSQTEQGLSRNDHFGSFMSDTQENNLQKTNNSNEINLESDDEDDVKFDQDALNRVSNNESFRAIQQKQRRSTNVTETVFQLLEDEDELGTLNFISTHFVDLTKLRDSRGYTVLHITAYKGLEGMCKMLIQLAKDKSLSEYDDKEKMKRVKEWVNVKTTDDEFTALHMASFSGKYAIVSLLIDNKANIYAANKDGLNMLHTAAQGDQAFMLYYFKELGLNINSIDNRGSTPLHWACFSKSEIAISYLLAWDVKIDEADQRGLTPLHLAVKAVNELNTTRPVRALLISGASRKKEDLLKRKPIDFINEVEDSKLQQELKDILKNPSSCGCLMLKTPLKKISKRPTILIIALFLQAVMYLYLYLFIFPTTIDYDVEQYYMYVISGLGLLSTL